MLVTKMSLVQANNAGMTAERRRRFAECDVADVLYG
jgi:hypothetical protein